MAVNNSQNSYKALLKRSQEPCDFCDRLFKNRYDSIIHNASHIIIPLIKQKNWSQCEICLYYFPSREELYDHHETKHAVLPIKAEKTNNKYNSNIKFENSDEFDEHDRYDSVAKIEDNYDFRNTSKHLKVESSIIKHENNTDGYVKEEKYRHDLIEIKNEAIKREGTDGDSRVIDITGDNSNDNTESIKSRLRFEEDDLFDDNVLSGLLTDCKVNVFNEAINQMPGFKNLSPKKDMCNVNNSSKGLNKRSFPMQNLISNIIKSNYYENPVQNGNIETNNLSNSSVTDDYEFDNYFLTNTPKVDQSNEARLVVKDVQNINEYNVPSTPEPVYKSIHYTELIKPGIYSCKYCFKLFPNRLLLIQHETTHIHIKKPRPLLCTYCDKYVSGNYVQLHKHIQKFHPGAPLDRKRNTHKCEKCGLKFTRYMSHVRNYHPYDCHECGKEFTQATEDELNEHTSTCAQQSVQSKILFVCELCFCFFKVRMNLKYILLGNTANEPGVRYPCAVCGKKYFELKMIKRTTRFNAANMSAGCELRYHKMRKPLTNEERLKKFQHRLKKINLLNKFYFAVLFTTSGRLRILPPS